MTVANATASAHDNAMPAAAWTDEWAHARRCARIGYGGMRARGVAPLAFVEHAARAFHSHVTRGIREAAVACASAGKFRRLAGAHRALRRFLVHFGRSPRFSLTSRPLLSRFSPSSFALVRRCSPVSRSVQPRFVAVRVRFVAVPAPVVAEPVKCAPSSRGTGATRSPGRCREDADRAPRLYRRSYPRYYNPPIAEQ
ncbi:hypothetical protein [Burkholderia multivorans]|uniref:hypothetical protein n=1 Tax=Burkholderia multivorans TaxID=87883 RepID=UPI0021599D3B|nr:hypothetical protein [Burkholderia multivorans]